MSDETPLIFLLAFIYGSALMLSRLPAFYGTKRVEARRLTLLFLKDVPLRTYDLRSRLAQVGLPLSARKFRSILNEMAWNGEIVPAEGTKDSWRIADKNQQTTRLELSAIERLTQSRQRLYQAFLDGRQI